MMKVKILMLTIVGLFLIGGAYAQSRRLKGTVKDETGSGVAKVDGALSDIPRRALYPQTELTTNPRPVQSAKLTDRVWWDVKQ